MQDYVSVSIIAHNIYKNIELYTYIYIFISPKWKLFISVASDSLLVSISINAQ